MNGKAILSVVSGILGILGFVPYIWAILRGKTKPAKASWLIWTLINVITLVAMIVKGASNPQIACVTAGSLIVVVLALKYGVPGWTKMDKICLVGSCIGIGFWVYLRDPTVGLVISLIVGPIIGAIPTVIAAYQHPERENKLAWTTFFFSSLCAILAIKVWDLDHAAQPVFFITNEVVIALFLWVTWRPKRAHVHA